MNTYRLTHWARWIATSVALASHIACDIYGMEDNKRVYCFCTFNERLIQDQNWRPLIVTQPLDELLMSAIQHTPSVPVACQYLAQNIQDKSVFLNWWIQQTERPVSQFKTIMSIIKPFEIKTFIAHHIKTMWRWWDDIIGLLNELYQDSSTEITHSMDLEPLKESTMAVFNMILANMSEKDAMKVWQGGQSRQLPHWMPWYYLTKHEQAFWESSHQSPTSHEFVTMITYNGNHKVLAMQFWSIVWDASRYLKPLELEGLEQFYGAVVTDYDPRQLKKALDVLLSSNLISKASPQTNTMGSADNVELGKKKRWAVRRIGSFAAMVLEQCQLKGVTLREQDINIPVWCRLLDHIVNGETPEQEASANDVWTIVDCLSHIQNNEGESVSMKMIEWINAHRNDLVKPDAVIECVDVNNPTDDFEMMKE